MIKSWNFRASINWHIHCLLHLVVLFNAVENELTCLEIGPQFSSKFLQKYMFWIWLEFGSSLSEVFCEKGVCKNFTKSTGKHLRQSLFFNKVTGLNGETQFKHKKSGGVKLPPPHPPPVVFQKMHLQKRG